MNERPFADLRETGLLWLLNRVVFHPRGYAFALHFNDDHECTGWSLMGDGTEPWSMADRPPDTRPADYRTEDELFRAVNELLR